MSFLSLYQWCLRKIVINLRDGIYKSCDENPFSVLPSKIVNSLMLAALDPHLSAGFRAHDLEQLLTGGRLSELKMNVTEWNLNEKAFISLLQSITQFLHFLKSGCQELKIFYLAPLDGKAWRRSDLSVARTRSEVSMASLRSEVSEALENLFLNTPNLENLYCGFSFDLKALRYCRKLRRLKLNFEPHQHWYEFLSKEDDHFQPHKHLEFFTVYDIEEFERIPYDDIVVILRHCPELTSLGYIESSGALSLLHRMGISPELKLRHCLWRDREYIFEKNPSPPPNDGIDRVKEAVLHYPTIEELDLEGCFLKNIPDLRNLRNLVYLNVTCTDNISGVVFNDALQAIGPQLKHLCFNTLDPIDLSSLLQNCHNLESFGIFALEFTEFANPAVSLPNLQRLIFNYLGDDDALPVLSLLNDCNQLTELILQHAPYFDDETLNHFLKKNSLSNLKVAYLTKCSLTEKGFKELLLNAPQLEEITIFNRFRRIDFEGIIRETKHMALCDDMISNTKFMQGWSLYARE